MLLHHVESTVSCLVIEVMYNSLTFVNTLNLRLFYRKSQDQGVHLTINHTTPHHAPFFCVWHGKFRMRVFSRLAGTIVAINCSFSVKFTLVAPKNMVNQSRMIIEFFKAYLTKLTVSIEIIFVQVDDQSWMIGF